MYYSDNHNDIQSDVFIRPIWICGRYNKEKHAALLYNLVEGLVYFVKEQSADIIGEILNTERDNIVNLVGLCKKYSIEKEQLQAFFNILLEKGILCQVIPDEKGILNYRRKVGKNRINSNYSNLGLYRKGDEESAENAYRELVNPRIGVIQIELTYNCSERCVHCYNPGATRNNTEISKRYRKNELVFQDYTRIIDELYDLGVYKINLTGGDPFSKQEFWDIIAYLHKKGIAYDIYTNGQALSNNDNIEKLLSFYPKSVSVSLYSGEETIHDMITRIPGSFTKTMRTLKKLSEFGIPSVIKCCIMKWNIKNYTSVKDIALQYGCFVQYDYKMIDSIDGDKCVSHYLLLDDYELELIMQDEYIMNGVKNYKEININDRICNAGFLFFCITPEGYVQPCNSFPLKLGSLKEQTFLEILNQSQQLKEWRTAGLSDFKDCGGHDYCRYCDFCVGINYCENGSIYKPSALNCKLAKVRFKLIRRKENGSPYLSRSELLDALSKINVHIQALHKIQGKNYRV